MNATLKSAPVAPDLSLDNISAVVGIGHSDWRADYRAVREGRKPTDSFGYGAISPQLIASRLGESETKNVLSDTPHVPKPRVPLRLDVMGVGDLLTSLATCCKPVNGDPIVGYVTRGRGITVHRRDCANALRHHGETDERLIEVSWGAQTGRTFPVDVEVIAYERSGLLRDITSLLANERINVIAVNTLTDKTQHVARMVFTLEVPDLNTLARLLAALDQIPNVAEVRRKTH